MLRVKDILLIVVGILSATIGLEGFLLPNHFIDGGVTGISMLVSLLFDFPLPVVILLINLPFVLLALFRMPRQFAIRGAIAILLLSIALVYIKIPTMTTDKVLAAVFGGMFLGGGIGFTLRGGAILDGTEVIALMIQKVHGLSVGDVILVINMVIFGVGAFFMGPERAMYSVLTYFSATRTIDFLIYGLEEHMGIQIVSQKDDEIKEKLISQLNRGVTVFSAVGGFSNDKQNVLYCVVPKFESSKVKSLVLETDPSAFLMVTKLSHTSGGMTKRRRFNH